MTWLRIGFGPTVAVALSAILPGPAWAQVSAAVQPCIQTCGFLDTCANGGTCGPPRIHLGTDYAACPGQVVYAPVTGTVTDAHYHEGYGGTVVIDTTISGEPAGVVVGHLMCDPGCLTPNDARCTTFRASGGVYACDALAVRRGTNVVEGVTRLGVVGPRSTYQNGGFDPHIHIGIRQGADTGAWRYYGYASPGTTRCDLTTIEAGWIDPATVITCGGDDCPGTVVGSLDGDTDATVTEAFGDAYSRFPTASSTARPGCAVEVGDSPSGGLFSASGTRSAHQVGGLWLQDFCQTTPCRRFPGSAPEVCGGVNRRVSADGLSAVIYNDAPSDQSAYLLRSGFWGVYKCLKQDPDDTRPQAARMGGPKWLGAPTSDERYPTAADIAGFDPKLEPNAAFQSFQKGWMTWLSGELRVHFDSNEIDVPSGVTPEAFAATLAASASNCGAVGLVSPNPPTTPDYCETGDVQSCYAGPAGTQGVGVCSGGAQFCESDPPAGANWTECGVAQVVPQDEDCFDGLDNDCDGTTDCDDLSCESKPECSQPCDACQPGERECTDLTPWKSGRRCLLSTDESCPHWETFACGADEICRDGSCLVCGLPNQPCCMGQGDEPCSSGDCVDDVCVLEDGTGGAGIGGSGGSNSMGGTMSGGMPGTGGGMGGMMGMGGASGGAGGSGGSSGITGMSGSGGTAGGGGMSSGTGGGAGAGPLGGAGGQGGGGAGAGATSGLGGIAGTPGTGGSSGGAAVAGASGTIGGSAGSSGTAATGGSGGAQDHDVIVRCDPPTNWTVDFAYYYRIAPGGGAWEIHESGVVDSDSGPAFEIRESLPEGWRLEATFHLTDDNGGPRWAYDFSTYSSGSGAYGVPQCATTATLDGVPVALQYDRNLSDDGLYPWCWYTNLNVPTATAPASDRACPTL